MEEKIFLSSTLLVPSVEHARSVDFYWERRLKRGYETIDIIIFNTDNKDEIKIILEKGLAELEANENPTANVENNISFIRKMLSYIGVTGYDHCVTKELVEFIRIETNLIIDPQKVIYISGVDRIENY